MQKPTREDWTGLGVSLALHLVLLVAFMVVAAAPQTPEQPLGLVEVEFGPFQQAQMAARAETQRPTPTRVEPTPPQPEPPAPRPQPQRTEPVNLPQRRAAPEPERVPPPRPQPERAQPQTQTRPQAPVAEPAPRAEAGGTPTGQEGTTSRADEQGDAATRTAPFNIEGLDRSVQAMELPRNPGARGTSVLQICVGPDGRVSRAVPVRRSGTPALDNAAQQAVLRWRFNPLPPAAPQVEQCGRITFHFSLN